MEFIDLNRSFVPIDKDKEPRLEIGAWWGVRAAGWLDWPALLERRRVVLLAEAAGGKTEEFQNRTKKLCTQGKAAFFLRIEDLADGDLVPALEPPAAARFAQWKGGEEDAWFFLDSVDEARLNNKALDRALRRLAHNLGESLDRARIFISCRVSDWRGSKDAAAIERLLPVREKPAPVPLGDEDSLLLDPIFSLREHHDARDVAQEPDTRSIAVVQLAPLDAKQRRALAVHAGVPAVDQFVDAIERRGLGALAERPGDLLELAEYWKHHRRFGSLAEMTEHAIANKLAERDPFRPDNDVLSPEQARWGAERLAAALTLAKSFTLRSPAQEADPSLASGAFGPAALLPEWSPAEQAALVRRGVFAPSTYGRVRFHHRGTQEYLSAQWLKRLLDAGCPREAVWDLIFNERYGVETLVPSLHATAAWLALDRPDIRDEIIRREPLVLLRHGDPRSLPIEDKKRLLIVYAKRHRAGEIGDDSVDHRALWLFSEPELADTIRKAWHLSERSGFRLDLLRIVREGAIKACVDLARGAALDVAAEDYLRIVGLEALDACGDDQGMVSVAKWLIHASSDARSRVVVGFAETLFPRYIGVGELLQLVDRFPDGEVAHYGFGYIMAELWARCPTDASRDRLLEGVAALCLRPPFSREFHRISLRHEALAGRLAPVAREAVLKIGKSKPSKGLINLLMAIERAEFTGAVNEGSPTLASLVRSNPALQRELIWADIDEVRRNTKPEHADPRHLCQICTGCEPLWDVGTGDLTWLYEDLTVRQSEADRQIALSAILQTLCSRNELRDDVPRIQTIVNDSDVLSAQLNAWLAPPEESESAARLRLRKVEWERERQAKRAAAKEHWSSFRSTLVESPDVLRADENLSAWEKGIFRLQKLTVWLHHRAKNGEIDSAMQWRLLEEGFGWNIAEAYRDGMKRLWRLVPPESPRHSNDGRITVKHTTVLSIAGLGIEAGEDADWATRLTGDEAQRAALHACLSEQGFPTWFDSLLATHPETTLPILVRTLRQEWVRREAYRMDFLSHYAWRQEQIAEPAETALFATVSGPPPSTTEALRHGLRILQRVDLNETQRTKLTSLGVRRFHTAQTANWEDEALHYLAILFQVAPNRATDEFMTWLDSSATVVPDESAENRLGTLFGRDRALVGHPHTSTSVKSLESLLHLAYRFVRPEHDRVREGPYTPDRRDEAESARNVLLGALLERPGADAYRAVRNLAEEEPILSRRIRFFELAHAKAEKDAEPPAWTPDEVLAFERRYAVPAKSGAALLRLVMNVLSDIQSDLRNADASSRPLLERAEDEAEVQLWIAERLTEKANGRFHVHRESQVSRGDKPDIIVSSTAGLYEVALEVKHGGMKWTVKDLERAVTGQLARNYLKPETRRHGILVVSHHGRRTWRTPETGETLPFGQLIQRLNSIAASTVENRIGSIEVRAVGIDASPVAVAPARAKPRKHGKAARRRAGHV